jgi:hypothetical protein
VEFPLPAAYSQIPLHFQYTTGWALLPDFGCWCSAREEKALHFSFPCWSPVVTRALGTARGVTSDFALQ